MTAAVFLDRDGVIADLVPDPVTGLPESPLRPSDVALLPGAAFAIRRLRGAGYAVVLVSNQPAVAKGTVTLEQLTAVQQRVLELLAEEDAKPDACELCFHHPDGVVSEFTVVCDCRKPAPGMLLRAVRDLGVDLPASWMIGDTDHDVAAGAAAGCRTVLVLTPGSAHKRVAAVKPDAIAADLQAAVEVVLPARGRARLGAC